MEYEEKNKMLDVKKHICPTCGGNLIVNIERQMYECPSCGVTFDYDYFREENVLGIAAQALKDNEFSSAGKAYDFMLEKEPDNFEALRGKSLIAMDITKIDDIRSLDLYSKINYESALKEIDRAIESSKPQDREYFTIMKDTVDAGHEYIDEKARLETQMTERRELQDRLSEITQERDTVFIYSSSKIRPKKAVLLTIFCYILCCLILFLGYKYVTRNPYSKAEDLSQYETKQTEDSDVRFDYLKNKYHHNDFNSALEGLSNYTKYQEALEREEQRKIKYDDWEKNHKPSNANLVIILCAATVIFALIVFILFKGGRYLDSEISKMRAKTDEQNDKIKNSEERLSDIKDRIDQNYKRLCVLTRNK